MEFLQFDEFFVFRCQILTKTTVWVRIIIWTIDKNPNKIDFETCEKTSKVKNPVLHFLCFKIEAKDHKKVFVFCTPMHT